MIKRSFTLLVFLLLLANFQTQAQFQFTVWAEEFNYAGLPDPAIWNMETGGGGWGNNESQYYTSNLSNAEVANGVLTITAKQENYGGNQYTSARITTQNKFDFKYGKIEARIKLPFSQGIWPAFWMLGSTFSSVGWPACGEIDIMEMIGGTGNDNTVHSTIHWDNYGNHAYYGQSYTLPSGIFADNYHIFSAEWDSQEIRAYMDGILYYVVDITPAGLSEFHNNFFIILNVAVGGNWPGYPNASTVLPQTMKVDYIRILKDNFPQPAINGPSLVVQGGTVTYSTFHIPELTYSWNLPADAIILSGTNSSEISVVWGATSDSITVTATGGTIIKTSDPFPVTAFSNNIFTISHIDNQNQLIWQVQPTTGNTVMLNGTSELEVDYSISMPISNAFIYYQFATPSNFWAIPKMKLKIKTENGNPPANLRVDLYDVNGVNNQGNFFVLDPVNSDGNYHIYYHNFADTPGGAFLIDQISEIRIYINYGNLVQPNSGKFWLQPIEMVPTITTAIHEPFDESVFAIYPNPFVDNLAIDSKDFTGRMDVNIYDIKGSRIKRFTDVTIHKKLEVRQLLPGIYIIEINHMNKFIRFKAIKKG